MKKAKWKTVRTIHVLPYQEFIVRRGKAGMLHIDVRQRETVLDNRDKSGDNSEDNRP